VAESNVRVQPDSSGKKVRTLGITTSEGAVHQQVVSIANARGDVMPTAELLSALGAMRIAAPATLFDSKLLYDKQPLFWAEALTGAGVSAQANSKVTMGVTGGTDSATRQTRQWFPYQSGKSQFIMLTGVFSRETGVTKRAGYFNGVDGIYLKTTGAAVTWEIIKGGSVAETVEQNSWNLDKLDGAGVSGITLDLDVAQLLVIDFLWLGVGRVRVGFLIGDKIVYVHAFDHANQHGVVEPYMDTPNLPVRYDITSTGGSGTLVQICSTVITEGGSEERGFVFSSDIGVSVLALPATGVVAVMAFRLKAGRLSAAIRALAVEIMTTTTGSIHWHLLLNPSIASTPLSYSAVGSASLERALGAAANLCTGGEHLDSGFVANTLRQSQSLIHSTLHLGSGLDGKPDVLVLGVENIASTPNLLCSMIFRELL
jgi:hypothetical protein